MFSKTDGKVNEFGSTNNKIPAGFLMAVENPTLPVCTWVSTSAILTFSLGIGKKRPTVRRPLYLSGYL
jgi:hypothetical protein